MVFEVKDHFLVPKQMLLSKQDIEELTKKIGFSPEELPQILKNDPAIKDFKPVKGDIVKIIRISKTAGKTVYYRRVV